MTAVRLFLVTSFKSAGSEAEVFGQQSVAMGEANRLCRETARSVYVEAVFVARKPLRLMLADAANRTFERVEPFAVYDPRVSSNGRIRALRRKG